MNRPFSIIDLDTTNLIVSYETEAEAWEALVEFGDPDFAVFEFTDDGRAVQLVEYEP